MTRRPLLVDSVVAGEVFLRRDVIAWGGDDRTIARHLRNGDWTRIRHGAYVSKAVWEAADEAARHQLRCQAVLRTHGSHVILSHSSAAIQHGLPSWGLDLSKIHLTRLDQGASPRGKDVGYHAGTCPPEGVVLVDGLPCTHPARAVLEAAMLSSVEAGVVLANAGLHRELFSQAEFDATYRSMTHWPEAQGLRIVHELATGLCQSVGESRLRVLFWRGGIPAPTLQYEVRDASGELIGISDIAWPEYGVLGEFDGKVKYEKYRRPGETPSDAVFREKRREDLMREASGCSMIRYTWQDFADPRSTLARTRRILGL